MKPIFIILSILSSLCVFSHHVTGTWSGMLKIQGMELRIVFHIVESADSLSVTMDSPDQGAFGIKTDKATFVDSLLTIDAKALKMTYSGTFKDGDRIEGVFRQGFGVLPLVLTRGVVAKRMREQDPVKPYPYREMQVRFENAQDTVTLAGTLTLPSQGSGFTAVVLVSGSGAQNRDEELVGHRPFLVLADHLTRNGIAVLRYDDRGVGESSGDFAGATTRDFARDAHSAVQYLATRAEINKIGIIGHSEGGLIASIVAANNHQDVDFIVLMAGTGVAGDSIVLMQLASIASHMGMSATEVEHNRDLNRAVYSMVKDGVAEDSLRNYLKERAPEMSADIVGVQAKSLTSDWYREFLMLDPAYYLERVQCPVLALNGDLDLQVSSSENLTAIHRALTKGGNGNFQTIVLAGLNHLFQECQNGLPSEYAQIEQTISPRVLQLIAEWIATY